MKFKKGDRVRQIKNAEGDNPLATVTRVDEVFVWHKHDGTRDFEYHDVISSFELLVEFKEGDRVRMKESCSGTIEGAVYTLLHDYKELWAGRTEKNYSGKGICGCKCQDKWELVMGFTLGDTVKVRKGRSCSSKLLDGRIGKVTKVGVGHCCLDIERDVAPMGGGIHNDELELVERGRGAMNKYQEMERRIDGITGWDKGADDILQEIYRGGKHFFIAIGIGDGCSVKIFDGVGSDEHCFSETLINFHYSSQCEKLSAFKKALLWLLEHSSIKKMDNQLEIDQIKADMKSLQDRLDKIS